jgi:hypothetical protein
MTPQRHNRDDDGDDVYENEEYNGEERRHHNSREDWYRYNRENEASKSAWSFTPQTVSTYLAVFGIVIGAAWTFSDFRVTLNDLVSRQTAFAERMTQLDIKINNIDTNGTRQLIGEGVAVKALKEQVEELKDAVDSVNGAIQQHNESMYDLYRKTNPGKSFPPHHEIPIPKRRSMVSPNQFSDSTVRSPIVR